MAENVCISCGLFGDLSRIADEYARSAFGALAPDTYEAFVAFTGVWFTVAFIRMYWFGELDLRQAGKQVALFVFVGSILGFHEFYFDWFYTPLRESMVGMTSEMVLAGSGEVKGTSVIALLDTVESEVWKIFEFSAAVLRDAGIFAFATVTWITIFLLPFLFVWLLFLAYMLEGVFKLMAVTAVGPVLIACMAFKPTRGFTMSGVRIALNGVLTVVFAGVAMGFTLEVVQDYIGQLPVDENGKATELALNFFFSDTYWAILAIGLLSILFHLKAATLASNLSGAMDNAGAAAIVAGAGAWVGKKALSAGGGVAGAAIGHAGSKAMGGLSKIGRGSAAGGGT